MSTSQITLSVSQILAPISKNGKVSVNNAKAAELLNNASKATVISAAIHSSGALRTVARSALANSLDTVESLLSADTIDGSKWGDLLTLLVGKFGASVYSRASMKGKTGCISYLENVIGAAQVAFNKAETRKAQERPMAIIADAETDLANVARLIDVAEQARINAEQAEQAEQTEQVS